MEHRNLPDPAPPEDAPEAEKPVRLPPKERFYERLPFTYRQVDIFLKFMIALVAVILVVAVLQAQGG